VTYLTEDDLKHRLKCFKGKTETDRFYFSAEYREEKFFLLITHHQVDLNNKIQIKIKVRDEDREKSYKSFDVLAKLLKKLEIENISMVLI
jgi:hypothetical protein